MRVTRRRMAVAAPTISGTASPFMRSATSSAAFMASPTSPSIMRPNSSAVSSLVKLSPWVKRCSACFGSSMERLLAKRRAAGEEIGDQPRAGGGEHRLGMELHSEVRQAAVLDPHQDAIIAPGGGGQRGRQAVLAHRQAVVAGRLEGAGQTGKQPAAVVAYARGLAVHQPRRPLDQSAEGDCQRLVAEADPEQRDGRLAPD